MRDFPLRWGLMRRKIAFLALLGATAWPLACGLEVGGDGSNAGDAAGDASNDQTSTTVIDGQVADGGGDDGALGDSGTDGASDAGADARDASTADAASIICGGGGNPAFVNNCLQCTSGGKTSFCPGSNSCVSDCHNNGCAGAPIRCSACNPLATTTVVASTCEAAATPAACITGPTVRCTCLGGVNQCPDRYDVCAAALCFACGESGTDGQNCQNNNCQTNASPPQNQFSCP